MKAITNLLHRTPWWALIAVGILGLALLGAFSTPVRVIQLEKSGETPEQSRAIKKEIDTALAESAIDAAAGFIGGWRGHTTDPARRQELDNALDALNEAREELRNAGKEAAEAKRDALRVAHDAARDAAAAVVEAQRETQRELKEAGVDSPELRKSLEDSVKAARDAEAAAKKALANASNEKDIVINVDVGKGDKPLFTLNVESGDKGGKPSIKIEAGSKAGEKAAATPAPPKPAAAAKAPAVPALPAKPAPPSPPALPEPPAIVAVAPLPADLKGHIRETVSGDIWRLGLGVGLIMVFIPLFIIAVIAKVFIDRSRAALKVAEAKKREADYHRMGQQVTEAKLQALQAQVEPHFLYNTLASVQALTEVDPGKASEMTGHLIQYLRNALPKMRESVSTVGQEVELVRAYLNILQMRMDKRLAFEIDVPAELLAQPFPPLMLPSLVENAIKHGLEPQREGGVVRITARAEGGKLRVACADTGKGFGEAIGDGVGLTNTRERLAALYGDAGRLTLEANAPRGVVATIEVPMHGGGRAGAPPELAATAGVPAVTVKDAPKGAGRKTLAVLGAAERVWRKSLSFAFVALVILAAVVAGLGVFGSWTGLLPMHIMGGEIGGPGGALVGTASFVVVFFVLVLVALLLVAIAYGLGVLFVALAIFIPIVVLVGISPVLAPFILIGLFIWWLVRRNAQKKAALEPGAAPQPPPAAP
jgi:hypothetical protein